MSLEWFSVYLFVSFYSLLSAFVWSVIWPIFKFSLISRIFPSIIDCLFMGFPFKDSLCPIIKILQLLSFILFKVSVVPSFVQHLRIFHRYLLRCSHAKSRSLCLTWYYNIGPEVPRWSRRVVPSETKCFRCLMYYLPSNVWTYNFTLLQPCFAYVAVLLTARAHEF